VVVDRSVLEHPVDLVVLVEEPLALGEEVPEAVDPLPEVAADEAGLEVVGEDRRHHLLRRRVLLEDPQVLGEDVDERLVRKRLVRHPRARL
jgi:hypothetical protein